MQYILSELSACYNNSTTNLIYFFEFEDVISDHPFS